MILLASLASGLLSALFPPANIEAYLVGLAAVYDGPVLWLAVLAVTAGHMCGKLLFYALGRGWLVRRLSVLVPRRHRSAAEQHLDPVAVGAAAGAPVGTAPAPLVRDAWARRSWSAARSCAARWSGAARVQELAGRPWATALLCFVSSSVGVPPFAVVAVLLGRFRMSVAAFLVVGGAGRLVRFAAVAGMSGAVLH